MPITLLLVQMLLGGSEVNTSTVRSITNDYLDVNLTYYCPLSIFSGRYFAPLRLLRLPDIRGTLPLVVWEVGGGGSLAQSVECRTLNLRV